MTLPFALNHINLWLLRDAVDGVEGWSIVDTCIHREEAKAQWEQVFANELEGLPVLRSTTNGISAVVDANGVVVHAAPRGVSARFDGHIPPAHAPTPFAVLGNALPAALALGLLLASALVMRRRRV